ncbi:sulfur carrier protein ThiS [Streptomyces sp. RerS4]|uniref:sulfur carrier protein ThiS n=1 Tax=Streptomyces sp. RerS4 TaxID=2942449 RepID=UPI00201C4EC6|nr:sulfur carrier protein ThiS [Streptomyces sp. RerS4]UQX03461.1 sulfur carrier protein ThiS [Streptomyces sp. RerS4]
MNVIVNGERQTVAEGCTAADVVAKLEVPERGVAVAVDGEVLPRGRWNVALAENTTIEILTAVQGG